MTTRCAPIGDTVLGVCPRCLQPTVDCYMDTDEKAESAARAKWGSYEATQIDCECYSCGHLWHIHAEAIDA